MVRLQNVLLDANTFTDEQISFTLKNNSYPRIWMYLKTTRDRASGLPVFYDPDTSTSTTFGDEAVFRQALIDSNNESFASSIAWVASALCAATLTSNLFHIVGQYADLARVLEQQAITTLEQLKQDLCCNGLVQQPLTATINSAGTALYFANGYDFINDQLIERITLQPYETLILETIIGSTPEPAYYVVPTGSKAIQIANLVQNSINNRSRRIVTTLNAGGKTPAKVKIIPRADLVQEGNPTTFFLDVALDVVAALARDRDVLQDYESINVTFKKYLTFAGVQPSTQDLTIAFGAGNSQFTVSTAPISPATSGGSSGYTTTLPTPTVGARFTQVTRISATEFSPIYDFGASNTTRTLPSLLTDTLYTGYEWECTSASDPNNLSNNGIWQLVDTYPKIGLNNQLVYGSVPDYNQLTYTGPHGIFLDITAAGATAGGAAPEDIEDGLINTFYFRVDDENAWNINTSTLDALEIKQDIESVGAVIPAGLFKYRVGGPDLTTLPAHTGNYTTLDSDNLPIVEPIIFRVASGSSAQQIAQAFNHSLFNYYKQNNILGAIVRNPNAVTCTINKAEVLTIGLTVDFLELPAPISIATGSIEEPLSIFSNDSKSVFLQAPLVRPIAANAGGAAEEVPLNDGKATAKLVEQKYSSRHRYVLDEMNSIYGYGLDK